MVDGKVETGPFSQWCSQVTRPLLSAGAQRSSAPQARPRAAADTQSAARVAANIAVESKDVRIFFKGSARCRKNGTTYEPLTARGIANTQCLSHHALYAPCRCLFQSF